MIKSFEITNYLGESVVLDLANPYNTGLAIESVTGLEPVKADIRATDISTMDGCVYNGSRISKRNIVFKFIFLESPTIEDSRNRCYKYFPVQRNVSIKVKTTDNEFLIDGYVESNAANIFSSDGKTGTQVSVICPYPYFRLNTIMENSIGYVNSKFEFPFYKEINEHNTIEFASMDSAKELNIKYDGTVPSGIDIVINIKGSIGNIILYNTTSNQTMRIYVDFIKYYLGIKEFIVGDTIYISTVKGNKYVNFSRNNNYYNIMSCIDINSDWFELQQGYNRIGIKMDTESGYDNLSLTIANNILFEGI